jgi:5-carboxymethyl-2-hydroxymuconate isomerase
VPQFIIEHANALGNDADIRDALHLTLECGASMDFINKADIKVRLLPYTHSLAGDGRTSFLHVTVYLLDGRTDALKETLSLALRDVLDQRFPTVQSISIDVRDMNRACYKKRLV